MRGVLSAVGIDPGTKFTGVSFVSLGLSTPAKAGVEYDLPFKCLGAALLDTSIGSVSERRAAIRQEIISRLVPLIEEWKPDIVCIEDPQSMGVGQAKKLNTVKVMIEEAVFNKAGVTLEVVHPATWRSHVRKFHGQCLPKQIKAISAQTLGYRPGTSEQDISDSIWIAATGLYVANGSSWLVS